MKRPALLICSFYLLLLCSCTGSAKKGYVSLSGGAAGAAEEESSAGFDEGEALDPAAYVRWMKDEDNGFRNEKTIGDLTFSAQYKTPEYITCMELHGMPCMDSVLKKNRSGLSDMQYYDLKILLADGSGELLKYKLSSSGQYNERVNYFAFGMQQDISLVDGKDTLPCALYHFERAYDVMPSATIVLGFSKKNGRDTNDKTLLVDDRTFNKGMLKFKFAAAELNNKPKLKTL